MKFLKIVAGIVLALILVLIIAAVVLLKAVDINKFVPQATQEASRVIGRELQVGHAGWGFSLARGIVIELKDISVADDPRFSDRPFLQVRRIELGVNPGAFLLERKIEVGHVVVAGPEVIAIRSKKGEINVLSIALPSTAPVVPSAPGKDNPAMALPALIIKDISISGGRVTYIDEMITPKLMLTADRIDIHVQDFSLTEPFTVKVRASLVSPAQDTEADLRVALKSPQDVLASLNGEVSLDAKDGVLGHVNLLTLALGNIPMLPGLLETIMPELPAQTQEEVKKGITRLESCQVRARIINGLVQIDTADLLTRDLGVHAKGWVRLVEDLDVQADIRISQGLSARLADLVRELAALNDEGGRIYVPVAVKGALVKPRVSPDMDYLTRKLIVALGGGQLQKALGGNGDAAQAVDAIFDMFRKK